MQVLPGHEAGRKNSEGGKRKEGHEERDREITCEKLAYTHCMK